MASSWQSLIRSRNDDARPLSSERVTEVLARSEILANVLRLRLSSSTNPAVQTFFSRYGDDFVTDCTAYLQQELHQHSMTVGELRRGMAASKDHFAVHMQEAFPELDQACYAVGLDVFQLASWRIESYITGRSAARGVPGVSAGHGKNR